MLQDNMAIWFVVIGTQGSVQRARKSLHGGRCSGGDIDFP